MNIDDTNEAIQKMKEIYPSFDVYELEDDVKTIFTKVYEECLKRNEEYIESVTSGDARGFFQASIRTWEEMQVEPYYKRIWNIDHIDFVSRLG